MKRTTKAKALDNHPGKRKPRAKRKSAPSRPVRPQDITARAKEEWTRVQAELDQQGRIAAVDQALIRDHCLLVARLEECEALITQEGVMVLGEKGCLVKNPACQLARNYRDQFQRSLKLLGLDPGSRDPAPAARDDDPDGLLD